jgi:hypothetical protein
MRLYDEIFKSTDGMRIARYTVVVDGGGYFEGVKAVGDFSPEKIVLFYGADAIEVEGKKLAIKKYCDGDLQLTGTIQSVRLAPQKEGK